MGWKKWIRALGAAPGQAVREPSGALLLKTSPFIYTSAKKKVLQAFKYNMEDRACTSHFTGSSFLHCMYTASIAYMLLERRMCVALTHDHPINTIPLSWPTVIVVLAACLQCVCVCVLDKVPFDLILSLFCLPFASYLGHHRPLLYLFILLLFLVAPFEPVAAL